MTLETLMTELCCAMIRRSDLIEHCLVAWKAIRVCKFVIAVDMTRLAFFRFVRSFQWKVRLRMIERRRFPCKSIVATLATMFELCRNMIRRQCLVEIFLMALITVRVLEFVISVDMAILA